MYDTFWPTLPKSGITSNSPSEIFAFMVACGNDFGVDMNTCCCELQKFNELNAYDTCNAAREAYRDRLNDEILYESISCEQQILRNELARQNAQTTNEETNESKMHDLYWDRIADMLIGYLEPESKSLVKETDYTAIGKAYIDSVRDVTYDDLAYLKPYDEIPKDIQTSDETEISTEKDDIYHDKSFFIRMIRKAVNRLDDFIGFVVRELKEDFI